MVRARQRGKGLGMGVSAVDLPFTTYNLRELAYNVYQYETGGIEWQNLATRNNPGFYGPLSR